MKFSMYDILSNIIPGFLILISFHLVLNITSEFEITTTLIIAYIVGIINNTLASWMEDIFYFSWGGKPSDQLLDGKNIWKVNFYELDKTKNLLSDELRSESQTNDALFQVALRYSSISNNERIKDFNSNYALSRNLIISFIISSILLNIKYWFNIYLLLGSIAIILIIWQRAKQRGFYFAKEVLTTYLSEKTNKVKDNYS